MNFLEKFVPQRVAVAPIHRIFVWSGAFRDLEKTSSTAQLGLGMVFKVQILVGI